MTRLLVNDHMTTIPGTRTFWHDLQDWFDMQFVGGDYAELAGIANGHAVNASLIIRNATWFGPIGTTAPTISLLQDIITEGPQREMQREVIDSSDKVVVNSMFTLLAYNQKLPESGVGKFDIIPLPVDFNLFEPGNPMGLQQALSLPDGAVCWIGACEGAAGQVKGYDRFLSIVRTNPDIPFVGVFKDSIPGYMPPNLRAYARIQHDELVKVIGACRVGLCTSRTESQHLAGIEMGACGLPMVAPPVGVYYEREFPGDRVEVADEKDSAALYGASIRTALAIEDSPATIRDYWQKEFSVPVIRQKWEKLVEEVECSGQS